MAKKGIGTFGLSINKRCYKITIGVYHPISLLLYGRNTWSSHIFFNIQYSIANKGHISIKVFVKRKLNLLFKPFQMVFNNLFKLF